MSITKLLRKRSIKSSSRYTMDTGSLCQSKFSALEDDDCEESCRQHHRLDKNNNKRVNFSFVEVRMYPIQLNAHPDCLSGPGVGLSMEHSDTYHLTVSEFEELATKTRQGFPTRLPRYIREQMLTDAGYSRKDIHKAVTEQLEIQYTREQCKQIYFIEKTKEQLAIEKNEKRASTTKWARVRERIIMRRRTLSL